MTVVVSACEVGLDEVVSTEVVGGFTVVHITDVTVSVVGEIVVVGGEVGMKVGSACTYNYMHMIIIITR